VPRNNYLTGLLYALACYSAWGIFPLYWKMLAEVPADQILAHRVIWSVSFLLLLLFVLKNREFIGYLKNWKTMGILIITGTLIGGNWFVYIYAVNHNHIVESSLGYYINPLVSILLGMIFLRERPGKIQIIAFLLAFAGVAWLTIHLGRLPWISLVLAFTFAFYALLRKIANLESLPGLFLETLFLSPFALFYLWFVNQQGTGMFLHHSLLTDALLILGGPVTALPLFWFGKAATRIPLSTIGFIQYLSPTLQLLIGLFVYNEPFSPLMLVSFGLVWAGLILFTFSLVREYRLRRI
jgi:chloramphenicol-sensitive protein RarD